MCVCMFEPVLFLLLAIQKKYLLGAVAATVDIRTDVIIINIYNLHVCMNLRKCPQVNIRHNFPPSHKSIARIHTHTETSFNKIWWYWRYRFLFCTPTATHSISCSSPLSLSFTLPFSLVFVCWFNSLCDYEMANW